MTKKNVLLIAIALLVGVVSLWVWQQTNPPVENDITLSKANDLIEQTTGVMRPTFNLRDLNAQWRDVSEWDGKILVINFWATWCPPCLREMPLFVELQEKHAEHGLQFIGIALDQESQVKKFAKQMNINYPVLLGEQDGIRLSRDYGNNIAALPYTAVVNRQGIIVVRHQGELNLKQIQEKVLNLL